MKKVTLLIALLLCVGIAFSGGSSIIQETEITRDLKSDNITQQYEISNDICKKEDANSNLEAQLPNNKFSTEKLEAIEADCGCWRHLVECGGARPISQCIRDYLDCVLSCDI